MGAAEKFEQLKKIGTPECRVFANKIFLRHESMDGYLKGDYIKTARKAGHVKANLRLLNVDHRLRFNTVYSAAMDVQELEFTADLIAKKIEALCSLTLRDSDVWDAYSNVYLCCKPYGVLPPVDLKDDDTEEEMITKIVAGLARARCNRWWRRQLKKMCTQQVEGVIRDLGGITKSKKSPYVSNWALARWQMQNKRNAKMLNMIDMENQNGDVKQLREAIAASVSNPVNRRNEFMTRSRGYEEVAKALGLKALFFTLTCPSKYHAVLHRGGLNKKYAGFNPRECADYLALVWSRIRAEWKRKGIKVFGFRVAEPHHDGTPHNHFLLFINGEQSKQAQKIFGDYAMAEDGDEDGADENRWDCVEICPSKGSATGYIAKYIAKNIDGANIDWDKDTAVSSDDYTGVTGEEGALRVSAWASIWGIRQFQQIGSVSVTVWREVRHAVEQLKEFSEAEVLAVVNAADSGDWAAFVEAMGGAFVARDAQTLRPRVEEVEGKPTRYGEPVKKLLGFWLSTSARHFLPIKKDVWRLYFSDRVCNELERKADFYIKKNRRFGLAARAASLKRRSAPILDL